MNKNRLYRGKRFGQEGVVVSAESSDDQGFYIDAEMSLKIRNHSPTGFGWGYEGSGSAQLALALLLEETTIENALNLYQKFKREFIAKFNRDSFSVSSAQIQNFLIREGVERADIARESLDVIGEALDLGVDFIARRFPDRRDEGLSPMPDDAIALIEALGKAKSEHSAMSKLAEGREVLRIEEDQGDQ